ncbi:DUF6520 family protein [Myroides odoratimimus]|uniref:DUF6520 family protein n=1 Tax=Myroides odoratimimus TaxID=76832 RepID=UPI0038D42B79
MKKFLKSAGLPIGVFALAIGSAFATNVMKSAFAPEFGYQKIDAQGQVCSEPRALCDTAGVDTCTWREGSVDHPLFGMYDDPILGTVCTLKLYKP